MSQSGSQTEKSTRYMQMQMHPSAPLRVQIHFTPNLSCEDRQTPFYREIYAKVSVHSSPLFSCSPSRPTLFCKLEFWSMSLGLGALADGDARSLGEHSGCDVHGCQLLEEEFCGIRDVDLRDLGLVFTRTTFEGLRFEFPIMVSM
jgi:hypothetical protein